MSLVREFLIKKYGAVLHSVDKTVQTSSTASQLLKRDPNRFGWVIANLSPQDAFLGFDGQVEVDQGILIGLTGEKIISFWAETHGELVTGEIHAISVNPCDMFIYEILGDVII